MPVQSNAFGLKDLPIDDDRHAGRIVADGLSAISAGIITIATGRRIPCCRSAKILISFHGASTNPLLALKILYRRGDEGDDIRGEAMSRKKRPRREFLEEILLFETIELPFDGKLRRARGALALCTSGIFELREQGIVLLAPRALDRVHLPTHIPKDLLDRASRQEGPGDEALHPLDDPGILRCLRVEPVFETRHGGWTLGQCDEKVATRERQHGSRPLPLLAKGQKTGQE